MSHRTSLALASLLLLATAAAPGVASAAGTAASAPAAAPAPAPAAAGGNRFAVSADGQEVTDTTTHLTWRRCVEGAKYDGTTCKGTVLRLTYGDAKKAATAAGAGWRVPTKDELVALVGKTKKGPWIDATAFPATPALPTWASRPGFDDNLNAWLVNFKNGHTSGNAGGKFPLRLVKAG